MKTISAEEFKKLHGEIAYKQFTQPEKKPSRIGTLLSPLKEGIQGLKTLYGGGEQGIARKLQADVQAGASDIEKGLAKGVGGSFTPSQSINPGTLQAQTNPSGAQDVAKGIAKAGLRTAGDVVGAIYAPIGAAIGATGIGQSTDTIANKLVNETSIGNAITDNKSVQELAMNNPNAGEDFGRALNLAFAGADQGKIQPSTVLERTSKQLTLPKTPTIKTPDALTKSVEQLRSERIKQGYEEQNTRLKSADRSFNINTKTYKSPDGVVTKVTPIDTLMKYNITPTVEKGTINMGDYKTGQGALGKIKEQVGALDADIEAKLIDSGKGIPLEDFKTRTIEQISKDPTLKQQGKVSSTIKKLEAIFDDYRQSYGDVINESEINAIRKVMNQDWNPDTVDVSHVIGDTARKIIYDVTPDQSIKMLLRQQGELLSAKKYAETINGTKVTGGRLGNMAMRTTGAILGSTLHNLPVVGPLIGMVGGEYLARGLQQTQFKSPVAEGRSLLQRSKSKTPTTSAKITPNTAVISKSKPQVKPTSSSLSTLEQEARKYKSAEEFATNSTELTYKNLQENPYSIKAYGKDFNEPVEYYRAGAIRKNGDIWLTDNQAGAQQYSSAGGGTKVGSYIVNSKKPLIIDTAGGKYAKGNIDINKILTKEEIAKGYTNNPDIKQKFIDYAKNNGYDAVQFADSFPDGEGGMRSLVVWDKNRIKTKSQLIDIWNKAVGKKK